MNYSALNECVDYRLGDSLDLHKQSLNLMYRPGHYEILYTKDDVKDYDALFIKDFLQKKNNYSSVIESNSHLGHGDNQQNPQQNVMVSQISRSSNVRIPEEEAKNVKINEEKIGELNNQEFPTPVTQIENISQRVTGKPTVVKDTTCSINVNGATTSEGCPFTDHATTSSKSMSSRLKKVARKNYKLAIALTIFVIIVWILLPNPKNNRMTI